MEEQQQNNIWERRETKRPTEAHSWETNNGTQCTVKATDQTVQTTVHVINEACVEILIHETTEKINQLMKTQVSKQ